MLGKEIVHSQYESQDFVIRKSDGMPTYHFAVVVDDTVRSPARFARAGAFARTRVANHIAPSGSRLRILAPIYAHLSVMLNPETGVKLSKPRPRPQNPRKRLQELMRSTKTTIDQAFRCHHRA